MAYSFASSLWDTSTGLLARQLDLSSPAAAAAVGEAQQQQSQQQVDSQDDLQQAYAKVVTRLHFYIIACFAVLVWDILITMKLEIQYVWPSRFTLVKVCYFLNRYLTLVTLIFLLSCSFSKTLLEHCGRIHLLQAYLPIIIFMCCNYKLAHRASALFYRPAFVFYSLIVVVLAQAIVQAIVSVKNQPIPMPPGVTGCYSFPGPGNENYAFIYWLLPLFTQTIVLVITLAKVLQYWSLHGRSDLLDIFLRDGIHFFAVTASSNIVNVVYMKSTIQIDGFKFSGANFNSALALIINSMMVSRLIIHMKIALATHSTVTYLTEPEKSHTIRIFDSIRNKLGLATPGTNWKDRRKDHHVEHGVTTIVNLQNLDKAGSTFTPFAVAGRKKTQTLSDESADDIYSKEIISTVSPTNGRGVAFELPQGHALSPPTSNMTNSSNHHLHHHHHNHYAARPATAGEAEGRSSNGWNANLDSVPRLSGTRRSAESPVVMYIGENYRHNEGNSEIGASNVLRNAIMVTTEKVVKTEGEND